MWVNSQFYANIYTFTFPNERVHFLCIDLCNKQTNWYLSTTKVNCNKFYFFKIDVKCINNSCIKKSQSFHNFLNKANLAFVSFQKKKKRNKKTLKKCLSYLCSIYEFYLKISRAYISPVESNNKCLPKATL